MYTTRKEVKAALANIASLYYDHVQAESEFELNEAQLVILQNVNIELRETISELDKNSSKLADLTGDNKKRQQKPYSKSNLMIDISQTLAEREDVMERSSDEAKNEFKTFFEFTNIMHLKLGEKEPQQQRAASNTNSGAAEAEAEVAATNQGRLAQRLAARRAAVAAEERER